MAKSKVTDVVRELAEPIVSELNLELFDVEFVKEGPDWYLRVYIDKPDGVTIEDCEAVSQRLSKELDRVDPIPDQSCLKYIQLAWLDLSATKKT